MHLVNKSSFPSLLKEAWTSAVTELNIVSGFRACGIMPFDRAVLPSSAFLSSKPTDVNYDTMKYLDMTPQSTSESTCASPIESSSRRSSMHFLDEPTPTVTQPSLSVSLTDSMQVELSVEKVAVNTSVGVDDLVPVIDISDPLQLLDLMSSGDVIVQDVDTSFPLDEIELMPMDTENLNNTYSSESSDYGSSE
ncbi:hypothetical protein DPMN_141522 [Dreissena polymorpha]|uniref:Uncharacterized protein n=1 Tax=Dreissena polymorpha TaxID=45954 RepID=A0A9D4GCW2_DREPO|nr:hypothetical protein DPMN_141522 [Dreissena polymorpha]